jgi:hypothetical protein
MIFSGYQTHSNPSQLQKIDPIQLADMIYFDTFKGVFLLQKIIKTSGKQLPVISQASAVVK